MLDGAACVLHEGAAAVLTHFLYSCSCACRGSNQGWAGQGLQARGGATQQPPGQAGSTSGSTRGKVSMLTARAVRIAGVCLPGVLSMQPLVSCAVVICLVYCMRLSPLCLVVLAGKTANDDR
jgi:hypothetical protein